MDRLDRLVPLSVVVIATLGLLAALDVAESVVSPIILGFVTGIVLSPLSDLWERWGFRPVIGATVSLFLTLIVLGLMVTLMQPIAAQLVAQAPKVLADMQDTVDRLTGTLRGLRNATEVMAEAILTEEANTNGGSTDTGLPTVTDAILIAPAIVAQATIFAGVLFFFLLTRHEVYGGLARLVAVDVDNVQIVARLRRAERHVSRYFLTVSLINAALAIATAAALQLLGLPAGILWGVTAGLFNFIVYLGPVVVSIGLLAAGVAAFDGAYAMAPAAAFVLLNFVESQFITPAFVGRQMHVNPLIVFCALVFGMWLWGPIGGLVALPIVIWARILYDSRPLSTARLPEAAVEAARDETSGKTES